MSLSMRQRSSLLPSLFSAFLFLIFLSCFGGGDGEDGSGSESPGCVTDCSSEEEGCSLAGLETKESNWNQSIVLSGEGTTTTTREITLTLSAFSSYGVTGYYLSEGSETPSLDASGWVVVEVATTLELSAVSFALSAGNGEKTVYGWFQDECGDISPSASVTVTLDSADPEDNSVSGSGGDSGGGSDSGGGVGTLTGGLTLGGGSSTTNSLTVSATITGTGTTPLIAYLLSETNETPSVDSSFWNTITEPSTSISIETSFGLSASLGSHTVYGWLKSQSGRISEVFSDTIEMALPSVPSDPSDPGGSSLIAGLSINGGSQFTNSRTVSLSLSGLATNPINGYQVSESATVPSSWTDVAPATSLQLSAVSYQLSAGDGSKTVYLHLRDNADNTASASASITLDQTSPTGSLSLDSGAKLTVDSTVSASITGSDAIGVVGYYLSSSSTAPSVTDSGWVAVSSTTSLNTAISRTLTDLTGLSTQYLWLKDASGNLSNTISDGIEVLRIYSTNSANDIGSYTSLAVDANDVAYISNYRATTGDLLYHMFVDGAFWAGGFDTAGDVGAGTSIAVDGEGMVHVAYRDVTNSRLKYAVFDPDTLWSLPILEQTIESGGISPSIGIDSNNKVHISHQASNKVRYVTNVSGGWVSQVVMGSGLYGDLFSPSSLVVDAGNFVHVIGSKWNPSGLEYATNRTGSWQEQTVVSGAAESAASIAVGPSDTIYASYSVNNMLRLATNDGGGWVITQIDSIQAFPTSIATDYQERIHIIYYDHSADDLKYATNYSGSWATTTLDSSGDVGDFCDLAIDSNDRLHVSYYDRTNGDLKYLTTAD